MAAAASRTGPPKLYKIIKELGYGGYGIVSQCCDQETGEELAVKTVKVPAGGVTTDKQMRALQNEVELLTSCQHERIVQYYGFVNAPEGFLIFLELMPAGSVSDQIKRDGPLTEPLAFKYTRQILEGLVYLHSKDVIHRDVKGGNVLRDTKGNVKLADFGLARQLKAVADSAGITAVGTAGWMAPEVFTGRYNFKADIWSVGCILVEMLTKQPPNVGLTNIVDFAMNPKAVYTLPPSASKKTKTILSATFKPSAKDRPSASELLEQFFRSQNAEVLNPSVAATSTTHAAATAASSEVNETSSAYITPDDLSHEPEPPSGDVVPDADHQDQKGQETVNVLLLGESGSGKSTTGNTILGKRFFDLDSATLDSLLASGRSGNIALEVMDCPGLYESHLERSKMCKLVKSVTGMHPGIHVLLFVVMIGNYTQEEHRAYTRLKTLFDDTVANHTILLFTGGDTLGGSLGSQASFRVAQMIDQIGPKTLQDVFGECGQRVVVFDNMAADKDSQVQYLLEEIRKLIEQNGTQPYMRLTYPIGVCFEEEVERRIQKIVKEEALIEYLQQLEAEKKSALDEVQRTKQMIKLKEEEFTVREVEEKRRREMMEAEFQKKMNEQAHMLKQQQFDLITIREAYEHADRNMQESLIEMGERERQSLIEIDRERRSLVEEVRNRDLQLARSECMLHNLEDSIRSLKGQVLQQNHMLKSTNEKYLTDKESLKNIKGDSSKRGKSRFDSMSDGGPYAIFP